MGRLHAQIPVRDGMPHDVWLAILIIAVVLSVLFQPGVFSPGNFRPHARQDRARSAGQLQVYLWRVLGAMTAFCIWKH